MTNDLKRRFEQLVAEPPSPSGVPSEAVFARVRSVRRRRTAGVATLAAAAVVAVAVAAGNFADVNSSPPVTGTPGAPTTVVTGPPTISPTTPASPTTTPQATRTGTTPATTAGPTGPGKGTTTGKQTTTGTRTTTAPPAQPPIDVDVKLHPTVNGRTVTMDITVSGTVIRPVTPEGQPFPADTSFLNLSGGTNFTWGDSKRASDGGSDGQTGTCQSKQRATGRQTYSIESHTYTKPGTYTFHYTVMYCGTDGVFRAAKTAKLVIK